MGSGWLFALSRSWTALTKSPPLVLFYALSRAKYGSAQGGKEEDDGAEIDAPSPRSHGLTCDLLVSFSFTRSTGRVVQV